jgi:tRNA pseudouridine13 synthase
VSEARFESPEDFVVEEIPAYAPEGQGDHTFVWVEKRLRTTEEVARGLARAAGVPARDVGYAGRKDRFAVTRQYFSVPGLPLSAALDLELPGVRVLGGAPHRHKLRTGHLAGNRFDLRVRGVAAAERARAHVQAGRLVAVGLPNRFGPQRFGRDGDNAERARRLLGGKAAGTDRREARFLISALQAEVFNEALRRRELPVDRVELGDLARRTDSGGLFLVDDVEACNLRASRFEISATGPIFGTRAAQPGAAVAEREREALRACGVDPDDWRSPRGIRMRGARRPVRARVLELVLQDEADALRVRFELPAGSFASVLLEELLGSLPERGLSSPP